MKKLILLLYLLSTPVMAGDYNFECVDIQGSFWKNEDWIERCENKEAICYRQYHHKGLAMGCFKK